MTAKQAVEAQPKNWDYVDNKIEEARRDVAD